MFSTKQFLKNYNSIRSGKLTFYKEIEDVKGGTYHHLSLTTDRPLVSPSEVPYVYQSVAKLTSSVSNPRELPSSAIDRSVRKIVLDDSRAKMLTGNNTRSVSGTKNIHINYNTLEDRYKYAKHPRAQYRGKYFNLLTTLMGRVSTELDVSDPRTQIVEVDISTPSELSSSFFPSLARYTSDKVDRILSTGTLFLHYEIEKFIGKKPSVFDLIPKEKYTYVNLHLSSESKIAHINLAVLYLSVTGTDGNMVKQLSRLGVNKPSKVTGTKRTEFVRRLHNSFVASETVDTEDLLEDVPEFTQEETISKYEESLVVSKEELAEATSVTADAQLIRVAEAARLNTSQFRRLKGQLDGMDKVKDAEGVPLIHKKVTTEDLAVGDITLGPDDLPVKEADRASILPAFDKKYVRDIQQKQEAEVIVAMANGGAFVTDYKRTIIEDITGSKVQHEVKYAVANGASSTVKMLLPNVSEDGTFTTDNTSYRMKKQQVDLPIKKIDYDSVLLSTYYGKLLVQASPLSVDSYYKSIQTAIKKANLDAIEGENYESELTSSRLYAAVAMKYSRVKTEGFNLVFSHKNRLQGARPGEEKHETDTRFYIGRYKGNPVYLDDEELFVYDKKMIGVGTLLETLNISLPKRPLAIIRILGKRVPVVVLLGYILGLDKLLALLDVKYVIGKPRASSKGRLLTIRFQDVSLSVTSGSNTALAILQGLIKLDIVRDIPLSLFLGETTDDREAYTLLLNSMDLGPRIIREMELLSPYFIDPMSASRLRVMDEPEELIPLVIRAVDLLDTPDYTAVTDSKATAIRGYERFPGIMYSEMVKAMRVQRSGNAKRTLNLSPYATWKAVVEDNSVKIIERSNPVMDLKDQEVVTKVGVGGRIKESLTADTRGFHPNMVGLYSEATTDSGDVGVNRYLSANPDIDNYLGMQGSKDRSQASTFSTTYMLTPELNRDNVVRVTFASIQNSHIIGTEGYDIPYVLTGYEYVMPYRVADIYALTIDRPGKVIKVDTNGIQVKHKNGDITAGKLGPSITKAEGKQYHSEIKTMFKEGDNVKKDDIITYDKNFFQYEPVLGKLIYKQTRYVNIALVEGPEVYEDSVALSSNIGEVFGFRKVIPLSFTLDFTDNLIEMPILNQEVKGGDPLFIKDTVLQGGNLKLDDEAKASLASLVSKTNKIPKAGKIIDIKVYYTGDVDDMSESLQKLVGTVNRQQAKKFKAVNKKPISGKVLDSVRHRGSPILDTELMVEVYLSARVGTVNGDKYILGSQLKATVSEVYENEVVTASGLPVDGFFSHRSADARMAFSYTSVGTTATALDALGSHLVNYARFLARDRKAL